MGFLENKEQGFGVEDRGSGIGDRGSIATKKAVAFLRHEVFIADHIISINLLNITGNINSGRYA